jgi:uncharacterized membrane protein
MTQSLRWPIIITASAVGVAFGMAGDMPALLRSMLAFWFLLICPGMAFVPLLQFNEQLTKLTLAIALSIALDTIVAETMVLARVWSPEWGVVVLIMLCLSGAGLQARHALARTWAYCSSRPFRKYH